MSEVELIGKRLLADQMAKKKARRDGFIAFAVVCTLIWLVALGISIVVYLVLCGLGLLIAAACSWVTYEMRYNKYYRIYLRELLR